MLRKIRIILAAVVFIAVTLLFAGIGRDWWGWLAKLQFLPSTLRLIGSFTLGNVAVVLGILLVALLVGRIYCSVICPLGVFQDLVIWLRRTLSKPFKALRKRFKFNKERRWVRYPVAAAVIACIITDLQIVVALIGPYSAYGRMVKSVIGPGPAPLLIAAAVTFVVIFLCAWIWGRAWCNTICPVGTVLGCVSRFQIFGVRVDEDKCVKCGACSHACKASCIEEGTLKIDYSRCVDCFDCIGTCKKGAISFGRVKEISRQARNDTSSVISTGAKRSGEISDGRRTFIATGALLIGTGIAASAQNMKVDGGLAHVEPKTARERNPRLVPPGAGSVDNFYDKCTACQLCVQNCPNGVLRPSTDLEHFLQPQMGYEKGFCRPECTACSDVCPSGAIVKVDRDAKTLIRIGTAVVNPYICLAASGEESCGNCARHCPTGAISMIETDGTRRPVVAEEQCIGCGNCEYLCPVRPESAISVKGLQSHISK
ncbi:MAG: 4Fe-4S binding protein [Bacteroidales bacterium]|nr:4Fe-4S binding protein [Bacteroidales bacterium]